MDQITNFFGGNTADREGLQGLFVNELKGIYYAEKQIVDALQEQADAATSDEVRSAFIQHKQESRMQVERLEQVFNSIGVEVDDMTCHAADGLIDDAQMVVSNTESGSLTRDAGLIIAAQKVEHHEIAAYGSLITLARTLGYTEAAQLLKQSLQEEKATDKKLTQLAESFVNQQAAGETDTDRYDDDNDRVYAGTTTGSGSSSHSGTFGSERGSGYGSGSSGTSGYVGGTTSGATGGSSYSSGTGSNSGSSYGSGSGSSSGMTGGGYSGGTSTGSDGSTGL
jgi:ferritin-like metal-binding protein YciE